MAKYIKKKALKNAIEYCTWYHINKNGKLVEGANPAEHEPLYKYSDIKKIIKGLPTRKFEDEPQTDCAWAKPLPEFNCKECKWWSPITKTCHYDGFPCKYEPIPII